MVSEAPSALAAPGALITGVPSELASKHCLGFIGSAVRATRVSVGAHRCHPAGKTHGAVVYSQRVYAMRHMKFLGVSYAAERSAALLKRSAHTNTHYTGDRAQLEKRYATLLRHAERNYSRHVLELSGDALVQCWQRGCAGYSQCSSAARPNRAGVPDRTCFAGSAEARSSGAAGVVDFSWCHPTSRVSGLECNDGEGPCFCST